MEVAQLRIYRAMGRKDEAARRARDLLARRRAELRAAGQPCHYAEEAESPVRAASLFAGEELRQEAVDALRRAMHCSDVPFGFLPQLPWFKALEGYPPYDELLREYEKRVTAVRAELTALDKGG